MNFLYFYYNGNFRHNSDDIRTVPSPDFITVAEATPEDIVIQWVPPQNHELITRYQLVITNEDDEEVFSRSLPGDTQTYTVQGS